VFHHFPHKQHLQLGVLENATRELAREVIHPAFQYPLGLPRLDRLVAGWIAWDGSRCYSGGCLFVATASEFDDRPGPVRDHLVRLYLLWQHLVDSLVRAAVAGGSLRPDTDRPQFLHDLHGIMLAYHHAARLLQDPDAERRALIAYCGLVERAGGEGSGCLAELPPTMTHACLRPRPRRAYRMSMAAPAYFTADMVRALPEDGNRYEVVYGELLVTPSPRLLHQRILTRLMAALGPYLEANPVGEVLHSPADISWDEDTLVQPDLFVVDRIHAQAQEWAEIRSLLLVIEVLSPSTARHDRFTKRRRYQEAGVPCYWIVDADARQVEVWTPGDLFPRIEPSQLLWHPAGALHPFQLDLGGIFPLD